MKKHAANNEGIRVYFGFLESVNFFVSNVPKVISRRYYIYTIIIS